MESISREDLKEAQITSRPEDPMESISREDLKEAQTEDQTLSTLWDQAKSEVDSQFVINNGILFHTSQTLEGEMFTQVVVPTRILKKAHQIPMSGHLGKKKTEAKILQQFFWPK